MKVLLLILSELSHETRLERMATSLLERGHQVEVSWVDNGVHARSPFWERCVIHPLANPRAGRRKLYFVRFMLDALALLERVRPGIVLAVDPPALLPAALLKARLGYRLVYDSREYYTQLPTIRGRALVRGFWHTAEGFGLRRAEAAFAVGPRIARALADLYECPLPAVVRNTPWRDDRPPADDGERAAGLAPFLPGWRPGDSVLLYQGGFWPGYDLRPVMTAVSHLPGWHFLALGDGPGWAEARRHASGLPGAARLALPGKVPAARLPQLTRLAHAGLIPVPDLGLSYRYLLPNKLFEYLQAGLPVLASPLPELVDVIGPGRLGLCADPADSRALAAALLALADPRWRAGREPAFAEARERWCWQQEQQAFLQAIEGDAPGEHTR
jgi:glycogen(starch) synthase